MTLAKGSDIGDRPRWMGVTSAPPARHGTARGQKIIEAAARALKPGGCFHVVANRGLPYEPVLKQHFASFEALADNNKFRDSRALR